MKLIKLKIEDVIPYENNPRYNDDAVDAVKESIKQCGYIQPIAVDENHVILCGHTRREALYQLGYDEVDVNVIEGLTEKQKQAFRLYDNKTSELASWDYDKLLIELDGLDMGDFDYFNQEIEKMAEKVIKENPEKKEKKVVICPRCGKPINSLIDEEDLVDD